MSRKWLLPLIVAVLMVAVFLAGCSTPTPTPAPTATPTVPPAISPVPTPAAGNDRANVDVAYIQREYSQSYEGIPAGPGEVIYAFDVTVDADKPVYTDASWFTVEYRQNSTAELKTYEPVTNIDYPSKIIGDGSGPAKGRLLFVLPAPGFEPQEPAIAYFKPLEQQNGPNKVYGKVYGHIRTT